PRDHLRATPLPYTTHFRSVPHQVELDVAAAPVELPLPLAISVGGVFAPLDDGQVRGQEAVAHGANERQTILHVERRKDTAYGDRSEEHTSELQSRSDLVCR